MTHAGLRPGRPASPTVIDVESSEVGEQLRPHPLGVRPEGNAFTDRPAARPPRDFAGRFRALPDELLAHMLEYLDARALCALGATCKLLHAFTRVDELWRALFVER
jgi:hypothetical protein